MIQVSAGWVGVSCASSIGILYEFEYPQGPSPPFLLSLPCDEK